MDVPTGLIVIIILFDEAFQYGDVEEFWFYVGTNTEWLCVEFCSFVQSHIFVN
jgi:hypothetical protein